MMKIKKTIVLFLSVLGLSSCAIMHHTQVGEVDSDVVLSGQKFEVLVSEIGFSTDEMTATGKAILHNRDRKSEDAVGSIGAIIALFQTGPKTGKPTFNDVYADKIYYRIMEKCPSGKVSGLTSIREMASYPIVSGEIVKIIGYCKS